MPEWAESCFLSTIWRRYGATEKYQLTESLHVPHVLVIGAGSIGKRHIKNLLAAPAGAPSDAVTVSVVEPRADRRAEVVALGVEASRIFESRDAALAAGSFDGAVVATPTAFHVADALACARAGLPLMIEKSLSVDMEGVDALQHEVESRGLFAFTAYCFRFDPQARRFAELLRDGVIGKPLYARAEMSTYLPEWHPHEDYRDFYMSKKALGGGTLLDQSHLYDMTRMFLGEIRTVMGISRKDSDLEIETDDFGEFLFHLDSGVYVSIHIDLFTRPWREFYQVTGSDGVLEWDIGRKTITRFAADGSKELMLQGTDYNAMYVNEVGYFLAGVRGERPEGPGFADGVRVMQVVEAIRTSAGERLIRL